MASIIQFIENRPSKRFEAHPRTEGLEHKYDVTRDDGVTGVLLMWGGGNAFKASVHMEGFEDRQRNVMRRAARNSKYDVARGEQVELKDGVVAAVLSIRGTPRDGLSPQEYLAAQEQAFSSAARLVSSARSACRPGRVARSGAATCSLTSRRVMRSPRRGRAGRPPRRWTMWSWRSSAWTTPTQPPGLDELVGSLALADTPENLQCQWQAPEPCVASRFDRLTPALPRPYRRARWICMLQHPRWPRICPMLVCPATVVAEAGGVILLIAASVDQPIAL